MDWWLQHAVHGNKPWAVQKEAMRRSEGKDRYGYFLEMGLGKTALTLNDYANSDCDICVVVAPNSFKLDWKEEPQHWGFTVPTGAWPRDKMPFKEDLAIFSINFEAIRTSAGKQLLKLFEERNCMLVIDESGEIKNPQSATAKAAIELSKRAKMVRILNGTPLVRSVMDYYPQLRTLGELDGMNPFAFRNHFAKMGGHMAKQVVGMKNVEELQEILDRCSFRALKSDWRDLPPKIHQLVRLEMTDRQRNHYREMVLDFFTAIEGLEVSADLVLTQMDKLRQIASCLVMQDGQYGWLEEPKNNPKMQATREIIDRGSGKSIVTYVYRASGEMLMQELEREGLKPAMLAGGMTPEEMSDNKDRFNKDPDSRVIVCQQAASFRGHTLLGGEGSDRCTKMVFFENSFSYYQRSQMEDRNHRGAQDQPCHYFDLVTSPIDEKYIETLRMRKETADFVDDLTKVVRQQALAV